VLNFLVCLFQRLLSLQQFSAIALNKNCEKYLEPFGGKGQLIHPNSSSTSSTKLANTSTEQSISICGWRKKNLIGSNYTSPTVNAVTNNQVLSKSINV